MKRYIIGGTLVTGTQTFDGDICLENGKITAIGTHLSHQDGEVYHAAGCYVFPGFIDAHTHLDAGSGITATCDDFASGTHGAICCGTTTILDFITQNKGETLAQALDAWHTKADGKSHCDYGFHMGITDWNPAVAVEMSQMTRAGVTSYKLYLAYDHLRVHDRTVLDILERAGQEGALVGAHCENGDAIDYNIVHFIKQGCIAPKYHPLSRPDYVEAEAVSRFCALGRTVGVPIHIVHLSTKIGLEQARIARETGQKVLLETCPQYLVLEDSVYDLPDFEGAKYVCSPPMRKSADCNALWQALSQDEISTISTDHCGFRFQGQKTLGRDDFSKIPNGLAGLAFRPQIIFTSGVCAHKLTLQQFVRLLSENPARQFGLFPRKGSLEVGSDGDVVVWDPQYQGTLTAAEQLHKGDYIPYEGFSVTGQAKLVFLHGELAAQAHKLQMHNGGSYISRSKCF